MSLYCPDCAYPHRVHAQYEEEHDGELIGFECEKCHGLFDEVVGDEDEA